MAAYAWLDKGITVPDSPQAEALLKAIDQKDWDGFLKNVYLRCGLERLAHGKPVSPKSVASWKNTKEFHEILAASVNDAKGKFQICGVMIVMMATLVFFSSTRSCADSMWSTFLWTPWSVWRRWCF